MGIFHAVQHYKYLRISNYSFHFDVLVNRPERNHTLMRDTFAYTVKRLARLEPYRHGIVAAEFDDFLYPRPARAV